MDVGYLPGITSGEVTALYAIGVRTTEDLWTKLSAGSAPNDLSNQAEVPVGRILEFLNYDGNRFARGRAGRWPTRHWLDLVAIAVLALTAFLAWRAVP